MYNLTTWLSVLIEILQYVSTLLSLCQGCTVCMRGSYLWHSCTVSSPLYFHAQMGGFLLWYFLQGNYWYFLNLHQSFLTLSAAPSCRKLPCQAHIAVCTFWRYRVYSVSRRNKYSSAQSLHYSLQITHNKNYFNKRSISSLRSEINTAFLF